MRHQSEAVLGFHSSVDIVVESGREGQAEMLEQSHSEQEDDGPAEIVSDAHAAPALERHETVRLLQSPLGRASSAPVRHVDKEALRTELQRIRPQGRIEIHCPPDGHDHGPFRDPITSQMAILKHHKRKYNLNRDKIKREKIIHIQCPVRHSERQYGLDTLDFTYCGLRPRHPASVCGIARHSSTIQSADDAINLLVDSSLKQKHGRSENEGIKNCIPQISRSYINRP